MRWRDGAGAATAGIIALMLILPACGKKLDESLESAEANLVPVDELNFAELMTRYSRGVVEPQPWVGYWWPYTNSGIASSWRDPNRLSPADKYDLAYMAYLQKQGKDVSKYESVAAWERMRHGPGLSNVANWWGHCNGWAAAALLVPEPRAPKMIEGIEFAVRDQKALLSEAWMQFSGDFVGTRVNDGADFMSAAFWDLAPAHFHLLLAHRVGRLKQGLIFDRHTGAEVWNQPLVAYRFEPIAPEDYLGAHPAYPDVYRVNVKTRIWWASDHVPPDTISPKFDMDRLLDEDYDDFFPGRRLRYELWLDAPITFDERGRVLSSGDILVTEDGGRYVGGVWKNGSDPTNLINSHPDYFWMPYGMEFTNGYKNPRMDDNWIRANIGG